MSYIPGRSHIAAVKPSPRKSPSRRSTVTPGQFPVRIRPPVSALNSVVLPQFGFPASAAEKSAVLRLPACACPGTRCRRTGGCGSPHIVSFSSFPTSFGGLAQSCSRSLRARGRAGHGCGDAPFVGRRGCRAKEYGGGEACADRNARRPDVNFRSAAAASPQEKDRRPRDDADGGEPHFRTLVA